MSENVTNIFPANDFSVVADSAKQVIECGLVIGYDDEGRLVVFGGGMLNGTQPRSKDWLWMIEAFKLDLVLGTHDAE